MSMNRDACVVMFEVSTGQFELWLCGRDKDGLAYPLPSTGGMAMPTHWAEALQDYKEQVKNDQVS